MVPTFNRGVELRATLSALLDTRLGPDQALEVIVVDDGSERPAEEAAGPGFGSRASSGALRFLRQENAGPAAARNAGFREATGEIVLFVDDDILVPPDLVAAHLEAHRRHPRSVVFGLCPYTPGPDTPFRTFLQRYMPPAGTDEFVEAPVVASGQISVERELFAAEGEVYASALSTPAAEEYELSLRLRRRGVPILCATRIVALHDQPVEVRAYCRQQYKHGVGCAEAAAKVPDTLCLQELATIIEANLALGGLAWLSPRALAKSVLSSSLGRQTLLAGARALEEVVPIAGLRRRAYYAAVSAHFVGGVRDGLVRFGARSHRAGHE